MRKELGWRADYRDNTRVFQYPMEGEETLFSVVSDNTETPRMFWVGDRHAVNLDTGRILFKGCWISIKNLDNDVLKHMALVYFRRHTVAVTEGVAVEKLCHFVGYKFDGGEVRICIPDDGSESSLCVVGD